MNSLATKIDRLKDEHADEEFKNLKGHHEEEATAEALFVLGRIKQNDHLGEAISQNLSMQTIMALQRFQQEKKHEDLGFATFDQFLNESPYSPMTKPQYYERLAVVNKLGLDVADLLTSIGISMRSQKLLDKGDLSIKGDVLYIGEKAIGSSDTGVIKEAIVELLDDRRNLKAENEKKDKKIETLERTNKTGLTENEELRRQIDALNEDSPFTKALMKFLGAGQTLIAEIRSLKNRQRSSRSDDDMKLFAAQWFRLRDAYGSSMALIDDTAIKTGDTLMDRALLEIANDDDFGDELEA